MLVSTTTPGIFVKYLAMILSFSLLEPTSKAEYGPELIPNFSIIAAALI